MDLNNCIVSTFLIYELLWSLHCSILKLFQWKPCTLHASAYKAVESVLFAKKEAVSLQEC